MADTIKVVTDAGVLGVLVLVLAGLGYLALRVAPAAMAWLDRQTARADAQVERLAAIEKGQAVTDAKIDALAASTAAMQTAIARLGEIGQAAIERVAGVVREEAGEVRADVAAAEYRITRAVQREAPSDPPSPPSRPSFTAAPSAQKTRVQ